MPDEERLFAHSLKNRPPSKCEDLPTHAKGVRRRAVEFAAPFGFAGLAAGIAVLHDVGKASPEVQAYILGQRPRGGDHSTCGARCAAMLYGHRFGRIMAYCIAGHHAGLCDGEDLLRRLDPAKTTIPDASRWRDHIEAPSFESLKPTNTALHERKRLLAARAAHETGIREDREITAVPAPWQPMDAAAHAGSIEPKLPSAAILYPSSQPPKSALPTSFVAPSLAHIRDDEIRAKLMREQVDRECRAEARAWTDEQRDLDIINSRRLAELDRQRDDKRSRREDSERQSVGGTPAPIAPVSKPTARIAPAVSSPIQPTWMSAYDEDEQNEKEKRQRRSGISNDSQGEKKPPPPVDPNMRGLQKRAPDPSMKTPLPAFSTEEGEPVGTLPITPRPQAREDNTIGIGRSKAVPNLYSPAMSKQDVRRTAIALGALV